MGGGGKRLGAKRLVNQLTASIKRDVNKFSASAKTRKMKTEYAPQGIDRWDVLATGSEEQDLNDNLLENKVKKNLTGLIIKR